ncbi:MAG: polymer-forming cytoskeletal protein [Peptococcaceae bacterium]|jgi:cytoskeletal protein CcmA (bactofilin family)|nr:polymer-forming cytoskeletal protein [Peptococcaceae bacterium]
MGIMDNFKQAVTELTGQDEQAGKSKPAPEPAFSQFRAKTLDSLSEGVSDRPGAAASERAASFAGMESRASVYPSSSDTGERESGASYGKSQESQGASRFPNVFSGAASRNAQVSSSGTVIAAGTVVDGNISSNDDLIIYGTVNGDVLNANKLVIHGEVAGSISARDINLIDSIIAGNVVAQENTEMTKDSCILGDLTTQNVVISGKVKGNIEARGSGVFKKESVVMGNVSVGTIIVEGGAKMRGFVSTMDGDREVDDDLFPAKK